ncbi:hypothetical protein [Actinomadura sp. 21ATH]|uniref:hypothetical protein n=1 Tax=Actinomadura sp. 21ATH TaxID=1735444 RepID=UPI0035C01D74
MSATFPSPAHALGGERGLLPVPGLDGLRPGHRVTVLVIVIVVIMLAWVTGRSAAEAIGLVLAGGAVTAQVCHWLGGRPGPQPDPQAGQQLGA